MASRDQQATRFMRAPFAVITACAFLAFALTGCGGDRGGAKAPKAKSASERRQTLERVNAAQVASRVETLRQLKYHAAPHLKVVTKEQSAQHARERAGALHNVREQEEVLKLLGVIPPNLSVSQLAGATGGELFQGYYEGTPPRVNLVLGPTGDDPKAAEGVLAHELLHGLDDQHFGMFARLKRVAAGPSDRGSAFGALVEGDATLLERSYGVKYGTKAAVMGASKGAQQAAKDLPYALSLQFAFTYGVGAKFVASLVKRAKSFKLVDQAFAKPPVSTAQVLHPEQYLQGKRPEPVRLSLGSLLGAGWNRLDSTTFGELEVIELLVHNRNQSRQYRDAHRGWAGGQIELWHKGRFDPKACPAPCRARDAVVLGLRWNAARDADEFARAFKSSIAANHKATPTGAKGTFSVMGAWVAIGSHAKETTVAYAPTPPLATRLATRAIH